MADERRFRRLAITSATVSAGALVLVIGGGTSTAGATTTPCPKGTDPASTVKNWQCQTSQNIKKIQDQINKLKSPTPTAAKPTSAVTGGGQAHAPAAPRPAASGSHGTAPVVSAPGTVTPYGTTARQVAPGDPQSVALPGLQAQQPEVAGAGTPVAETHIIAPVADSRPLGSPASPAVTAAAAGLAGAVAALNFSVLGRRLRRAPRRR